MTQKNRSPTQEAAAQRSDIVRDIIRMSQKALGYVLAMIAVGYIGGLIAIIFNPALSEALSKYASIFTPVFQLEIGVYGLGSTLENVQKIKAKIDAISTEKTESATDDMPG